MKQDNYYYYSLKDNTIYSTLPSDAQFGIDCFLIPSYNVHVDAINSVNSNVDTSNSSHKNMSASNSDDHNSKSSSVKNGNNTNNNQVEDNCARLQLLLFCCTGA